MHTRPSPLPPLAHRLIRDQNINVDRCYGRQVRIQNTEIKSMPDIGSDSECNL
jgi:hypothetical protein